MAQARFVSKAHDHELRRVEFLGAGIVTGDSGKTPDIDHDGPGLKAISELISASSVFSISI